LVSYFESVDMLGGDPEYPAIWGALLILNWPVYAFVYRQIFLDRQDLKQCVRAALKPSLFWKWGSSEPWSAGKATFFFLACGVIVWFEYAVLCRLVSKVLS
jgi:hypothetical protein